ncbi:MAG: DUF3237 domain-containing protein [Pseudoxanthomonas sp.]
MKQHISARFIAMACALWLPTAAQVDAAELKETIPNRIKTELVMKIEVKTGPIEDMGKGSEGPRINYPIIGGSFIAKGPDGATFTGEVVPGGADFSIERNDGVTKIDALYRLKTDDGQIIIVHNYGLWRATEQGMAKMAKGQPPIGEGDSYVRTVPSFSTQPGKYDWLEDYTYVGTLDYPAMGEVVVDVHRVDGP